MALAIMNKSEQLEPTPSCQTAVIWSGKPFQENLPVELLWQIAEHYVEPSEIDITRNNYVSSTRDLLKRCCSSMKFASAALKVYIARCTVQLPASTLLSMAQTTPKAHVSFWARQIFLHRLFSPHASGWYASHQLCFSARLLRKMHVSIRAPRSKSNICDYTGLVNTIPQLHVVLPRLEVLEVHVLVHPDEVFFLECRNKRNGFNMFWEAQAITHGYFLRLAVSLNTAQNHIARPSIVWNNIAEDYEVSGLVVNSISVPATGDWNDVMMALIPTPLFQSRDFIEETEFLGPDMWFAAWSELGAARTKLRTDGSRRFQMEEDVVSNDGPRVLLDRLEPKV